MKIRAAALGLVGASLLSNEAQAVGPVELTPHVGVQIGGFATQEGRYTDVETGMTYGAALDYRLSPVLFLRAAAHRQETELIVYDPGFTSVNASALTIPLSINYFHLGGTYEHALGRVRAVLGLSAGATQFAPRTDQLEAEWYFSGALEGALKIGIIENLGARIHTRLLVNVMSETSRLFCFRALEGCEYNWGGPLMGQAELGAGVWMTF